MSRRPGISRPRATRALRLLAVGALVLATVACVQPYTATEGTVVYVLADHFHAEILIQEPVPGGYEYTLYAFLDRSWSLDGAADLWGGARAILSNTDAAVAVGHTTSSLGAREVVTGLGIGTALNGWRFLVPADQVSRAREHVERVIIGEGSEVVETRRRGEFDVTYRAAAQPYHLFYTCNQFVADVMTVAGVSFEPVWYHYTVSILRDRLNQLVPMVF